MWALPQRRRFFLLLIPCALGLLFFAFATHAETRDAVLTAFTHTNTTGVVLADASNDVDDGSPLPTILLVTAFFPLLKSKHSVREYEQWLSRFLQPITTDIYFYAAPDMEALVRKCRGALPITVDTTYSSPFDIPPLNGSRSRYQAMHALDRERARHSPELYAVWNAKPYFLDEAVQTLSRAGKAYNYAFWTDAGSFREAHGYASWPSPARVREVWDAGSTMSGEKAEDLLFFPVAGMPHPSFVNWVQDQGPVDAEVSEGSFFGGSPHTIAWWRRTFYAYHDHYLALGIFVGKDQTLINALFLLFPSRFIGVWLRDPAAPAYTPEDTLGNCPDWWYYQFWLAPASERQSMREILESRARWSWGWWRKRQPCRVTRVSVMKTLLQRQFGSGWEPPTHTITAE